MEWSWCSDTEAVSPLDVLVLPCWEGKEGYGIACEKVPAWCSSLGTESALSRDFLGKEGETAVVYTRHTHTGPEAPRILLVGCGMQDRVTSEVLRKAVASAIQVCQKKKWAAVGCIVPKISFSLEGWVEGIELSRYFFDQRKHDGDKKGFSLQSVTLMGVPSSDIPQLERARVIIRAVNMTRDLVNQNASEATPQCLAEVAYKLSQTHKALHTHVLGKQEIVEKKLGLLMAVGQGAACDPALIFVEYRGNPNSKELTALVGKGITYDTGGLVLKPKSNLATMKCDMAGAAAVLGTMQALAELALPVNVIGVVPAAENAIGPRSYKLGDVYTSYSGKTVEISDTDAEGRLVLADAIAYVQDHYPVTRIIDIATLTGGVVVALGEHVTGLFSNDAMLAEALTAAGERCYERLWRLPLYTEYEESLKSSIADLKNAAGREASSINGALFIKSFVRHVPWAHLDVAGTAYLSAPRDYHPTPATGVGVRLFLNLLSS